MLDLILKVTYPFAVVGYMFLCLLMGLVMLVAFVALIVPGMQGLIADPANRIGYVLALFYGASIIGGSLIFLREANPNRN